MCTERSRDGTDLKRNLTVACNVCNSIKGNRALEHARPNLIQQRVGWPRFNQKQLVPRAFAAPRIKKIEARESRGVN